MKNVLRLPLGELAGDDPDPVPVPVPVPVFGPIQTLLSHLSFDEVHLLSHYGEEESSELLSVLKALDQTVQLHIFSRFDSTNYQIVFEHADHFLGALTEKPENAGAELSVHLSSGTPTMTAVWVLLGKSRYPARFYQTYSEGDQSRENLAPREETIPFDLVDDYFGELLRSSDSRLNHLIGDIPSEVEGFEHIIGKSEAIRLAVERARRAAMRGVSVLLTGESGTGKGLFARAIHQASPRRHEPFVSINCAAIPDSLLEAELFGYLTSSLSTHIGFFERADKGTLFLDEIDVCSPEVQIKLLQVLQPIPGKKSLVRRIHRVGEAEEREIDVRIVAATNKDLVAEVAAGRFREDLYDLLAVISIALPALRNRKDDSVEFAESFLAQINEQFREEDSHYQDHFLSVTALQFIQRSRWPGNVRELYNVLLQSIVMTPSCQIEDSDIEARVGRLALQDMASAIINGELSSKSSSQNVIDQLRSYYIERALEQSGGDRDQAAFLLGFSNFQTLIDKMKQLGFTVCQDKHEADY